MVSSQTIIHRSARLIFRVCMFMLLAVTSTGAADWTTWTSYNDVRRMCVFDDTVFMATSGGLLLVSDPGQPGIQYNNVNGLGTVDITDIMEAADGQKWVTGFGQLIRFDGSISQRYPFADANNDLIELHCVEDDGDSLWVGTELGLILFSKVIDGGHIMEDYQLFGNMNPSPDVYDIELVGDTIWLATSAGLAMANKLNPKVLKSPESWTVFDPAVYNELETQTVRRVVEFETAIYIATERGAYRWVAAGDTLIKLRFATTSSFTDMKVENDSLFLYSSGGTGVLKDDIVTSLSTTGLPGKPQTGANTNVFRWVGIRDGGVYHNSDGSDYTQYSHTGLPGNDMSDVTVRADGLITLLLLSEGPYELHSGEWVHRPIDVHSRAVIMQTDIYGQNWIGTYGGGASRVGDTVVQYIATNSTFEGVGPDNDSNYVVCLGLVTTGKYIFGGSTWAWHGHPVAIGNLDQLDSPDGWTSLGYDDGITNTRVVALDYRGGVLAVASGGGGVFNCYIGPNPFDKSDYSIIHYTEDNSRLVSDVVNTLRFSPGGELWVGTNRGISRYDIGIDRFVDVYLPGTFGSDVQAIEFDSRGNAWVGGANGLVAVDGATGESTHYTARNSGLVNDQVFELTVDELAGVLYVATYKGLSILRFAPPATDPEFISAYPNPWVTSETSSLSFDIPSRFTGKVRIRVFTVSGELVAELPEMSMPVWDGCNQAGRNVVSGVYLFVLSDEEGEVGRGKFLLVRD